jgi:hypothetical protein
VPFRRIAERVQKQVGVKDELELVEFFEEAVRLHETHAEHARQLGDEVMAFRAHVRAARARERLRILRESYPKAHPEPGQT